MGWTRAWRSIFLAKRSILKAQAGTTKRLYNCCRVYASMILPFLVQNGRDSCLLWYKNSTILDPAGNISCGPGPGGGFLRREGRSRTPRSAACKPNHTKSNQIIPNQITTPANQIISNRTLSLLHSLTHSLTPTLPLWRRIAVRAHAVWAGT